MFTPKHYEAIASMLQWVHPARDEATLGEAHRGKLEQWSATRDELAKMFKDGNAKFDVARFERACQPGANVCARSPGAIQKGI
jgi:hypothetical protein